MYKPIKRMCDVCGGVCGGVGYKMADGKWCCRECFDKTKLRNPEDVNRMSADTVTALKLRSEEKSPYELNITKMHEEREAQSNKEFAPVRIFIGIVFIAIVFISMIVMVVETSDFTGEDLQGEYWGMQFSLSIETLNELLGFDILKNKLSGNIYKACFNPRAEHIGALFDVKSKTVYDPLCFGDFVITNY